MQASQKPCTIRLACLQSTDITARPNLPILFIGFRDKLRPWPNPGKIYNNALTENDRKICILYKKYPYLRRGTSEQKFNDAYATTGCADKFYANKK